ncbi:hypothetical protein EHQ12_11520, partial [Leptospira gomenensis]
MVIFLQNLKQGRMPVGLGFRLILAFLCTISFSWNQIEEKKKNGYIPMEKAEFEYEWEAAFPVSVEGESIPSLTNPNSISKSISLDKNVSAFEVLERTDSVFEYVFENDRLTLQFETFLNTICDRSAFFAKFQSFSKSRSESELDSWGHDAKEKGLGVDDILVVAWSPNISETSEFKPDFSINRKTYSIFVIYWNRSFFDGIPFSLQRALIPGKLSRYFALLFHFPPHFNLG